MPNNSGTLVAAPIMPFSPSDIFPTHYTNLGAGGWHQAADVPTMNAIPSGLLVDGMPCWVTSTQTLYQYNASTTSWNIFSLGGGSTTTVTYTTIGMTLTTATRTLLVNSSSPCTINLPANATNTTFTIKNIGTATVTVMPNGTDKVETLASLTLLTMNSADLVYYLQNWYLV
jgi:hypothetical protein